MIHAVIVDDETFARENLSRLLEVYCPEVEVVGSANSVESALKEIEKKQPELVFLDVHLAQDTSFSILSKFDEITFSIIFTSGFANYAIDAFKVNAIDYILKPIDSDDLVGAIRKYKNWKSLSEEKNVSEVSIKVHHKDSVSYLPLSNVVAFLADDNYTTILSSDGQKFQVAKTLREFEDTVADNQQFIRISRSVIVQTRYIKTYSKNQPYFITTSTGNEFEISRRRRSEVISALESN